MNLRRRMENDVERDIRDHIELETSENIERGMSPQEARLAALRKFGNPALVAEDTRAVWRWMWLDRLLQDIRYAQRTLRRNPVFALVAILTLALGAGMNTAVFSIVSGVLIKPLPYRDPQRLVWLANYNRRFHFEVVAAPDFSDWQAQAKSFEAMAGYQTIDSTILDGEESGKHGVISISPEFWQIAGVQPAAGRLFSYADHDTMVLTWQLFQSRFGGDKSALGRVVRVDGRSTTIIGVLPKDFRFLPPAGGGGMGMTGDPEAFTPMILNAEQRSRGGRGMMVTLVVAKLKPGVSAQQARAEILSIQAGIASQNPLLERFYSASELRVTPLKEKLVGETRRALLILLAAVAFVLLIACANMGNLLLARATARQREIAIRIAIGAGRNRLVRHFLVEGITLALIGGAVGVALARGAIALLMRIAPAAVPRLGEISIDWRVLLFTLAVSIFAGVVFGLAPMLSLSPKSLHTVLKDGAPGTSGSRAGFRLRQVLVAAELALALVLLTGAGLMVKSFSRMYAHPAAFQPEKIALLRVFLSGPAYRDLNAVRGYVQRLLDPLAHQPTVEAAAVTAVLGSGAVDVEGSPRFAAGTAPMVFTRAMSSAYPRLIGLQLLKGRWITDDEPGRATMINETFAHRVFGAEDPLGQRVRVMGGEPAEIVGLVADLKTSRLDAEPDPEMLISYKLTNAQAFRRFDLLVKGESPAVIIPEARRLAHMIDRTQPPYGVTTLEGALIESIAPRRFNLLLLGSFALTAVMLALIGIYGVMSYAVTQRTQEIGVRMALGARRREIVGMVVRQGMAVALAGISAGLFAAYGLTRLMASLLYDVKPTDPWTFLAVAAVVIATALIASALPALRAARVDPLTALRYE
uniref:Permease n=1 Tax=Solibacter usitatus (strain Ellin6076) TaxID=234267 RepID=Q01TA0_SOLUE